VGSFQAVLDVADGLEEYMDLLTTAAAKVQNTSRHDGARTRSPRG
jgi:hypothetical protein